uniref:CCHC-type domain-containing protein n=1 Tax=Tanacetum cinerariifolium TaxID=118510 RepID=A0A6L2LSK6_TANCI|nr:hypothetical protein [Tanacetum cinerariifolium]
MPPRMRTRSASRPAAESRGGGTGNDQGIGANKGIKGVNGNVKGANGGAPDFSMIISQQLQDLLPAMLAQNNRNVLVNGNRVGCSYKEFLACNPKEYDGKGDAVVLTRWIKKMENVQDMGGCSIDQKVKYTAGLFVGKALTWWNSQIRTLSREVAVSMSWNKFKFMIIKEFCPRYVYGLTPQIRGMVAAMELKTMQKAMQIFDALTDEAVRNGSIKKVEKRGNVRDPSKDKNGRDDNKRTRTGNVFATIVSPIGRENTCTWPKCATYNSYHAPGGPCRTCFNCNCPDHLAKDCRSVSRNVNLVNAKNPPVRARCECGSTDHGRKNQGNQARGRAFMLGAKEARQNPNIVTGIEPSDLGFRYEIEIASWQLVEIDKSAKAKDKKQREIVVVRDFPEVKEYQEKDKIGSIPDKNGKRGEAEESLK